MAGSRALCLDEFSQLILSLHRIYFDEARLEKFIPPAGFALDFSFVQFPAVALRFKACAPPYCRHEISQYDDLHTES